MSRVSLKGPQRYHPVGFIEDHGMTRWYTHKTICYVGIGHEAHSKLNIGSRRDDMPSTCSDFSNLE